MLSAAEDAKQLAERIAEQAPLIVLAMGWSGDICMPSEIFPLDKCSINLRHYLNSNQELIERIWPSCVVYTSPLSDNQIFQIFLISKSLAELKELVRRVLALKDPESPDARRLLEKLQRVYLELQLLLYSVCA